LRDRSVGDESFVPGNEMDGSGNGGRSGLIGEIGSSRTVLDAVPMDELLGLAGHVPSVVGERVGGDIMSGLATLLLMVSMSIWLTSEFALDFIRLNWGWSEFDTLLRPISPSSSSPGAEGQESLMSSVKRDSIEKREERVPPVETSLRRW
jgi:hypothetical protein